MCRYNSSLIFRYTRPYNDNFAFRYNQFKSKIISLYVVLIKIYNFSMADDCYILRGK